MPNGLNDARLGEMLRNIQNNVIEINARMEHMATKEALTELAGEARVIRNRMENLTATVETHMATKAEVAQVEGRAAKGMYGMWFSGASLTVAAIAAFAAFAALVGRIGAGGS